MENSKETEALILAHPYSRSHKSSIIQDKLCGCFYCLEIFPPEEISDWVEDDNDKTALCPYCGIDSVLGESCGFPLTSSFLKKMNTYWF